MFGHASGPFSSFFYIYTHLVPSVLAAFRVCGAQEEAYLQHRSALDSLRHMVPSSERCSIAELVEFHFFIFFPFLVKLVNVENLVKKLGIRNSLKQVLTGINRLKTWGDELCNVDPLLITPAQHGTNAEGSPSKSFNFATLSSSEAQRVQMRLQFKTL